MKIFLTWQWPQTRLYLGFAVPVFKKHQSRVILVFRLAILLNFEEIGPCPVHFARTRARAFVTYRVSNPGKSN